MAQENGRYLDDRNAIRCSPAETRKTSREQADLHIRLPGGDRLTDPLLHRPAPEFLFARQAGDTGLMSGLLPPISVAVEQPPAGRGLFLPLSTEGAVDIVHEGGVIMADRIDHRCVENRAITVFHTNYFF